MVLMKLENMSHSFICVYYGTVKRINLKASCVRIVLQRNTDGESVAWYRSTFHEYRHLSSAVLLASSLHSASRFSKPVRAQA